MAATGTNADIESAKTVCSQAILYRTKENDASLYFAVCDNRTQTVYFCPCDPSQQTFEDVSHYSMHRQAEQIVKWLKTYIQLNSEVLC
jgi:hypothetical protein